VITVKLPSTHLRDSDHCACLVIISSGRPLKLRTQFRLDSVKFMLVNQSRAKSDGGGDEDAHDAQHYFNGKFAQASGRLIYCVRLEIQPHTLEVGGQ